MKKTLIKVGFYQFQPIFGKKNQNLDKIINTLNNIQTDLIVLPELVFTGYHFENRDELRSLSEEVHDSIILKKLTELCRQNDFYIVTGFAERYDEKLYNSAVLVGHEGVMHTYRKLHLFNEEKLYFDPGDIPLQINEINGTKIGIMICWDWIYPEVVRKLAIQGADIICHPSNLVLPYCQYTMVSRCMENSVFAITANRIGSDKKPHSEIKFTGRSQIVAPKGKIIYQAEAQKEKLYIAEIDLSESRDKKMNLHNDLFKDRRPDYYS